MGDTVGATTPEKRRGRPRKHESDSARVQAFRARFARLEVRLDQDTHDTITRIARDLDQPTTVLVESMLKFALANRQWSRFGLAHQRKKT